ncbi:MAG: bifunctional pantoate--beta-alanine ligase/(d)CMP kinase [Cyanobacteria bacterium Co-bin8]|nr:bifunctional pantoate--beta-alanine ligase/(d)CMP kinase [Cyanobacteria bacterium Co-bin8]
MRVLKTIEGLNCCLAQCRHPFGKPLEDLPQVGLVPTMGALHRGHLSLIERARRDNEIVVVTIFVNPLQFGPGEDLERYPQTLGADLQLCDQAGADIVFVPTARVLYGMTKPSLDQLTQVRPPGAMTKILCGQFRPGHFEGVATVVTKLLNIVRPDRAYFGQKDAQQLAILKQLAKDLNLPGELVGCPIVRDTDGLALSSRNRYLNGTERSKAAIIHKALQAAEGLFRQGERQRPALVSQVKTVLETVPEIELQYVDLVHPETMLPLEDVKSVGLLAVAAFLGTTRLIDNVVLRSRRPIVAIDGPAGAGKSTVARQVARDLGLLYLDSGAMYRAVTWLTLQKGLDPQDEVGVAELIQDCHIRLVPSGDDPAFAAYPSRIWINGEEVTRAVRNQEVTGQVSAIAAQPVVRATLLKQQQQYGAEGGVVMEGRDIGTQVFPHAELKIFLTASVSERAKRRQRDLQAQNQPAINLEDLERAIDERDRKDSTRRVAPLRKAPDALELQTDNLTIAEVVANIVDLFHQQVGQAEQVVNRSVVR